MLKNSPDSFPVYRAGHGTGRSHRSDPQRIPEGEPRPFKIEDDYQDPLVH